MKPTKRNKEKNRFHIIRSIEIYLNVWCSLVERLIDMSIRIWSLIIVKLLLFKKIFSKIISVYCKENYIILLFLGLPEASLEALYSVAWQKNCDRMKLLMHCHKFNISLSQTFPANKVSLPTHFPTSCTLTIFENPWIKYLSCVALRTGVDLWFIFVIIWLITSLSLYGKSQGSKDFIWFCSQLELQHLPWLEAGYRRCSVKVFVLNN